MWLWEDVSTVYVYIAILTGSCQVFLMSLWQFLCFFVFHDVDTFEESKPVIL